MPSTGSTSTRVPSRRSPSWGIHQDSPLSGPVAVLPCCTALRNSSMTPGPVLPTSQAGAARRHMLGSRATSDGGSTVTSYRPMTLADLAGRLARTADDKVQWKLVWEFLEEYRWEITDVQLSLLQDEPSPTGDERWDTLLAALAEHLAAGHDAAPPQWAEMRVLRRPWFPAELEIQRAEALVWAPAAFRKHGVY